MFRKMLVKLTDYMVRRTYRRYNVVRERKCPHCGGMAVDTTKLVVVR